MMLSERAIKLAFVTDTAPLDKFIEWKKNLEGRIHIEEIFKQKWHQFFFCSCNVHHKQLINVHFQACIETTRKVFKWNIETKHEQKKSLSFAIQIAISRALFSVVMECLFLFLNEFFLLSNVCACCHLMHAWDLLTFSKQLRWMMMMMMWVLKKFKDCSVFVKL